MASRQGSKSKRTGSSTLKAANSPSSSTTSSSKHFLETSIDGLSSPASSSAVASLSTFTQKVCPWILRDRKKMFTVTVRFRPLRCFIQSKEIRQGEEIAWYADGETIVRNEHNPSIAYCIMLNKICILIECFFMLIDRVFGPTTTTRHVYDVAAQHIVGGAMEGINGKLFCAYDEKLNLKNNCQLVSLGAPKDLHAQPLAIGYTASCQGPKIGTIFAYGVTSSGKTHTMHVR
ncbi:Kinesin-like protein KIN-7K, chloroplastic [Vitis vinifera]|uniref:Kinesin-like protein KIN-7K, chloroplastic n=1 Tax=Vitis vinifera TaxID=29760 RepID=A0A438D5V9_VITVI|nr:Kinesin-like protein KIN-7K, chloroplastic [Vitis vinifera]